MSSLAPVFALLVAQAPATQMGTTSWPSEFSASGSVGHISQGSSYGGWQGSGGGGATWFVRRPLVDDGKPFALQSYLQRLDGLSLGFGGSGFSAKNDQTLYERSAHGMNATLGGLFYLDSLVVGGGLFYDVVYDVQVPAGQTAEEKHTTALWSPHVTAGLRQDAFEVLGVYRLRSYHDDGVARPLRWGQASLRLRSVLKDQFAWRVDGYTVVGGGGASFNVESFPSQDLGFWLSGYLELGQIYVNSSTDYQRQGASVGIGLWGSNRFELQFSIGVSTAKRADGNGTALTTTYGALAVVLRAPERHHVASPAVLPATGPVPAAEAPPLPAPVEVAPPAQVHPSSDVTGPEEPVPSPEAPLPAPAPPAEPSPREPASGI